MEQSAESVTTLLGHELPVHNPVLIVAIAMAAFLIMPLITNRLRLPDIIGILVAGIVVGPHGIGLLERDETIQLLGTVGLLYLVFLAGLEVDLGDLSRKRNRAVSFGVLTFLVPQVLGTIGSRVFFGFDWPTAILLGSVFSSHSFLALLIAKRLGLTEREMSIAVIGGTVITDTLALLVLAVVAQTTEGDFGPVFLLQLLFQAGVFAAAVVFGVPFLGRWFFRNVSDGGAQFAFMMTVLFVCGFVAHEVKLEPIIGAFLAGLAMNRLVPHHGVLANRAFFVGNTIFVPFFLLSVGMLIDLRMVISDLRTIEMAIFMTLTVVICKGGAAWLTKWCFGYSRADAVVAWGLSLPQAATTLAVVLVGHKLGLFDDAILNATIVMVLVTCVVGPILVEAAGRRIAAAEPAAVPDDDEGVFQRILIPLANPQSSNDLLDLAIALRRKLNDEPLLPLSVSSNEHDVATSERLLGASVIYLAAAEVPVKPVIRVDPNPVNGILRAQSESRASCMVMGWAGPEAHWQRHFHLNRGVIDDVVDRTTGQLLVVRLTQPLSVLEQVVVVVPALAHTEPGFLELLGDIKLVAKRIGAQVTMVCEHPLSDGVRAAVAAAGAKCPLEFVDAAADLQAAVDQRMGNRSWLVLVGCREGTVSWDGHWSRFTTRLAHRHHGVSMAVAYPRIEKRSASQTNLTAVDQATILNQAVIRRNCRAESLQGLIRSGLPEGVAAVPSLVQRLEDGVSALGAEVALVHTSVAGNLRSRLAILVLDEPFEHQALHIRVLLVLINPLGMPANRHLEHLATIAKAFSQAGQVEALVTAASDAEARRALLAKDAMG